MGVLFEGEWRREGVKTDEQGRFQRAEAQFRNQITREGPFRPEPERYHLYVSLACPWAHRTLIFRKLKRLEELISVSVVHPFMGDDGWTFEPGPGVVADSVNNKRFLREVYLAADSVYTGRVSVPVLWDKEHGTIVNNESSEIIRIFNGGFDSLGAAPGDYYPEPLRAEIDTVNARVYETVNNGVYRSGFAASQGAYTEAVDALFDTLDWLEQRLSGSRYLDGNAPTEADWRLFPTLVRFDSVYVSHFKCNKRRIVDYPNLWAYTRDLYQHPGVAETVNLGHIKQHYFTSHTSINPHGLIAAGPDIDFDAPHNRDRFG